MAGPRGTVVGPLRVALYSPELASRWQKLGEFLRFQTQLPVQLSELAIITVARHWNSKLEWFVHAEIARKVGLPLPVIEAIRTAKPPVFEDPEEALVYDYTRELLQHGDASDPVYEALRGRLGDVALVELTALVGYYTMVAMTLNAHRIPQPDGDGTELDPIRTKGGRAATPAALAPASLVGMTGRRETATGR